jgi:hypothetical protein
MEKLTSILAVALDGVDPAPVLDKAVALARAFHARIEVLVNDAAGAHAINTHCALSRYDEVTLFSVANALEPVNETILRRVWSSRPDLVIKPRAAPDSDFELVNECLAPVLLVRRCAWERPARFAVAVDVCDEDHVALARSVLHTAGFLAHGVHGHLDVLYSEREAHDEAVRVRRAVVLAQIVREFHVGCERLQIFAGEPDRRLPPLIAARRYDVLVLGSPSGSAPRGAMPRCLRRFLDVTECDVVLVHEPGAGAVLAAGAASARHQRANQA